MGNSSSLPDLAAAGFLSQSRGHSDPSRMSALLAAESVASCNLSAGALCSAPPHSTLIIMRRPVSMMRSSRSLDPGGQIQSNLSRRTFAGYDVTGIACDTSCPLPSD